MLRGTISQYFKSMQRNLFPGFCKDVGIVTNKHLDVIVACDVVQVERFIPYQSPYAVGKPPVDRGAFARAFLAKAVLNIPTTIGLIDRLKVDAALRRLCGFEKVPCAATFSNVFAEFSESAITEKIHEILIREVYEGRIVGHVSRDATAINGREKPGKKEKPKASELASSKKRGRPKKGEQRPPQEATRIEKQMAMSVGEMLADLPTSCDVGGKKNSQGNTEWWVGYKLHLDVDDYGIPLTAITTSASMNDSQAAIPLETLTSMRVVSLYSLMDAAYNSDLIEKVIFDLGKVPVIDPKKPRGGDKIPLDPAKKERYKIRTTVERTNSAVKDDFGGRFVRVRGHAKVSTHLMFGVLAMCALRMVEAFT